MKKSIWKKGLVLGIIMLFVGAGVVPIITRNVSADDGNQPPVAVNDVASTPENTPVLIDILANDYDPDGTIDPTTVTIVTNVSHGSTSVNPTNGMVTYTSDTGYEGPDYFTYTVKDNEGATSNIATVSITVVGNDPPVAVDDFATTPMNTPVIIDILANDYDHDGTIDPTTVTIVTNVSHGSTSVNPTNGMVTYTPNFDYYGPDSFFYTVKDNSGWTSNVAKVSITVICNYPPYNPTIDGPIRGEAGVEYTCCVINATDPDGDDLWANFSWGDGTYSGWIGPNVSGEDICASHAWERGNYEIKAKLKDEWGLESPWSDPLPITIPKNKPFNFNFPMLSWLFERFPNAFPILRYMLGL
jgi:hypothetical protein